ncbi:LacI family DNA-binding transcriptional regulator [Palleronia caenipelagi]|uniref:LacI family DNA-binding transcriptional regulator n=1 Tax=Palleronia caenipelagi TaxID=2489174 RepID=A0A547PN66_9RHOB|nr:LacI family DNA-binding transcriptional regulator [Palleronia caenipelagi]TRD15593.1 LacI family DNA-binding transcriptional regulator [Palleronia caenipelagi]
MAETKPQTIYDIARLAEASPSTVSAALNGNWKKRRIARATVERIQRIASEHGYSANQQARALRTAKSGLVGMILPQHDNRFFSSVGQCFSNEARARGGLPAIVSTRRERDQEVEAVRQLISYSVDALMLVGTTHPEELSAICRAENVPHVFVDQPCQGAPSVVTDNRGGARALAEILLQAAPDAGEADTVFLGGNADLPATSLRILGYQDALRSAGRQGRVIACGYRRAPTRDALTREYERRGRLPEVLLVNSIGCLEGVLEFLVTLPLDEVDQCQLGSFDFDPFGRLLRHPIPMVRQRADELIRVAYDHLDGGTWSRDSFDPIIVAPELILPDDDHFTRVNQPALPVG